MEKCTVIECGRPQYAKGVCQLHYKRLWKHGTLDANLRPHDWGAREKHPLYKVWNALMRQAVTEVAPEWRDLWSFVRDCPPRPEGAKHTLQRPDRTKPIGPGNVYWRKVRVTGTPEDVKQKRRDYAREWRVANPRKAHDTALKRVYGIRVDEYERMFAQQGGVCAICRGHETMASNTVGMVARLAVDHCHATGKIRALLCNQCNRGLGRFRDDINLMEAAVAYLRKHQEASA